MLAESDDSEIRGRVSILSVISGSGSTSAIDNLYSMRTQPQMQGTYGKKVMVKSFSPVCISQKVILLNQKSKIF